MKKRPNDRNLAKLAVAEDVMRSVLCSVGPKLFAIALNNISMHGEIFIEQGIELDEKDEILGEWFDGIETLNSAADKM